MQLIRGLHNLPSFAQGTVVTIGDFDGVHRGHQAILQRLKQTAQQLQAPTCVLIFEPQPREYFAPESAPARLTPLADKLQLLEQAGVDYVVCIAFNERFRQLSAEQFVEQVLVTGLHVRHLQIGDDFRFGCDRSGDYAFLLEAGQRYQFSVEPTTTVQHEQLRISSTRVREALAAGDLALTEQLLGHKYWIKGRVLHGKKLGRTLNAPTANVQLKRKKAPLQGVFLVKATLDNGQHWPAVANIGVRPSVETDGLPHLEVHLLGFQGDLYGQRLRVEFVHKIRDEQKFASLDALQAAIASDIKTAKDYWQKFHTL